TQQGGKDRQPGFHGVLSSVPPGRREARVDKRRMSVFNDAQEALTASERPPAPVHPSHSPVPRQRPAATSASAATSAASLSSAAKRVGDDFIRADHRGLGAGGGDRPLALAAQGPGPQLVEAARVGPGEGALAGGVFRMNRSLTLSSKVPLATRSISAFILSW